MKNFNKQPKVLHAVNGEIKSVQRYHDNVVLSVGDKTKSGGKILSIKMDTQAVGNMYAEIGKKGSCTAIACIVPITSE